jgi:hypothetical protein
MDDKAGLRTAPRGLTRALYWNRCPDRSGISSRVVAELAPASFRNRRPDHPGIRSGSRRRPRWVTPEAPQWPGATAR